MTHQEHIARVVVAILALPDESIVAFRRGNPFDKLLRSFDEFNAQRLPLYKKERSKNHYKLSKIAYASGLPAESWYGEHQIPLNILIKQLLASDRTLASVEAILRANEVVLITKDEARRLDGAVAYGGLGLRSRLREDGIDRLDFAQIDRTGDC